MNQVLRNRIYGVATAVFTIAVVLGAVDQVQADEAANLLTALLDEIDRLVALGVSVLAFVKSLPSRVTTLEHGRLAQVDEEV